MRKIFFTDYTKGKFLRTVDIYHNRQFLSAITSHAFKDPEVMFRVHQFYLEVAVKKAEKET